MFQDAAKPVTELPFPSVTICSPGLNMEAVEKAILDDFEHWRNETGKMEEMSLEDQLEVFMEEKYATTTEDILETIRAMHLPPGEKENGGITSAILQNLAACESRESEVAEESSRRKRSSAGKSINFYDSTCC